MFSPKSRRKFVKNLTRTMRTTFCQKSFKPYGKEISDSVLFNLLIEKISFSGKIKLFLFGFHFLQIYELQNTEQTFSMKRKSQNFKDLPQLLLSDLYIDNNHIFQSFINPELLSRSHYVSTKG